MKSHERRRQRLNAGFCGSCGKVPVTNRTECDGCREKRKVYQRENYRKLETCNKGKKCKRDKLKKCGLCSRCGKNTPAIGKATCENCIASSKVYVQNLKDLVYSAYGGYKCACCGETIKHFLTLDHKNNDGAKHRKEVFGLKPRGSKGCGSAGTGPSLFLWLIRNNFPPIIQVLCANCNLGKHLNGGICPHHGIPENYS